MKSCFQKQGYNKHQHNPEHGFTLIEILVSLVVLSFGLLGMVGIQALALKSNADAKLQSSAVRLGRELGDMMRGNKAVALQTTSALNPYLGDWLATSALPPNTAPCFSDGAAQCTTPLLVANWEISDWVSRVRAEFPGARAVVCFDETPYDANGVPQWICSNTGDSITIKIGWIRESTNKTRSSTGSNEAAFEFATRPSVIYNVTPGSPD